MRNMPRKNLEVSQLIACLCFLNHIYYSEETLLVSRNFSEQLSQEHDICEQAPFPEPMLMSTVFVQSCTLNPPCSCDLAKRLIIKSTSLFILFLPLRFRRVFGLLHLSCASPRHSCLH